MCRVANGYQHVGITGSARHLPQPSVLVQVGTILSLRSNQYTRPASIQTRVHPDTGRRRRRVLGQVDQHGRAAIEPHHADRPGQARAKVGIVAMMQNSSGQELPCPTLRAPHEAGRQTSNTGLTGRILNRLTPATHLELETANGRGGGHPL